MCGPVWYTVTILTEEGILIITDTTALTNYNVIGLNDNTVYTVTVTASNNVGSMRSTISISTLTNNISKSTRPVYVY